MNNLKKEIKKSPTGDTNNDGYRIVYFNGTEYTVGEYCKSIEGFMIGFTKSNPIFDEEEIPKFISIDDLLNRYLKELKRFSKVSLYKIDGECIATKHKNK